MSTKKTDNSTENFTGSFTNNSIRSADSIRGSMDPKNRPPIIENFTNPKKTVIEYYTCSNTVPTTISIPNPPNVNLQPIHAGFERQTPTDRFNYKGLFNNNLLTVNENLPFCNDDVSIDPPNNFAVTLNQQLARGANPVTKIAPVVIAPSHDLGYWRDNNLIVHSAINSEGQQQDLYLSGYAESTCCGYLGDGAQLVPEGAKYDCCGGGEKVGDTINCRKELPVGPNFVRYRSGPSDPYGEVKENYSCPNSIVAPVPTQDRIYVPTATPQDVRMWKSNPPDTFEGYACPNSIVAPVPTQDRLYAPSVYSGRAPQVSQVREGYKCPNSIVAPVPTQDRLYVPTAQIRENYEGPSTYVKNGEAIGDFPLLRPAHSGDINQNCGYNPMQIRNGLPSNYPAGNCQQDPRLKQYNENLFTQIVTPGVYTRSQINEPINSNIGISFQQQFEPVTCKLDEKGITYTQHDPRVIDPALNKPPRKPSTSPNYDNVFDPRFYGYGTSYRSYIDENTGQPRFMYDDVNAIRMPNYVTRSKIDFLPYADSYGPMVAGSEFGNVHNPHIRALAQDSWLRDSLTFRNDMTERLMRKVNADAWQQRVAPLGPRMR